MELLHFTLKQMELLHLFKITWNSIVVGKKDTFPNGWVRCGTN